MGFVKENVPIKVQTDVRYLWEEVTRGTGKRMHTIPIAQTRFHGNLPVKTVLSYQCPPGHAAVLLISACFPILNIINIPDYFFENK